MERLEKPVFWTNRAKKDLEKLIKFYAKLHSEHKAIEIANSIYEKVKLLENKNIDLTKIGAIDDSFLHLKHQYRKLIEQHCKITYREGKNKIYIIRVFDTRQNPIKNK